MFFILAVLIRQTKTQKVQFFVRRGEKEKGRKQKNGCSIFECLAFRTEIVKTRNTTNKWRKTTPKRHLSATIMPKYSLNRRNLKGFMYETIQAKLYALSIRKKTHLYAFNDSTIKWYPAAYIRYLNQNDKQMDDPHAACIISGYTCFDRHLVLCTQLFSSICFLRDADVHFPDIV